MQQSNIKDKFIFFYKIVAIIFVTIFYSFKVSINMLLSDKKNVFYKHYYRWAHIILSITQVKLEISGFEYLNQEETYIFVSNHSSLFDIPIILYALKQEIRIMYKRELEKIPIFGWTLKQSPFIAVTRTDPRNAMASIQDAINTIKEKISVLIFPEGTRSLDGKVGEFKRGAFMLAIKSEKPIVPITVSGSFNILPSKTFKLQSGVVKFFIHKPIPYKSDLNKSDEKKLMEDVRNTIISSL